MTPATRPADAALAPTTRSVVARRGAAAIACCLAMLIALLVTTPADASAAPPAARDVANDTVRLVVRVVPAAGASAAVTASAEAAGAVRTHRIARLHSLSFEVPPRRLATVRYLLARRGDVTDVEVAHVRRLSVDPNDPRLPEQRSYLAAIGATAAWDRGAVGSPSVRIAIVDSGLDVTHPDLAGKVVGTYNAVTGGTDVRDVVGHGTATASVAAAATDDGVGMAGAGRNTSLLGVKVADVTGRIFTDDLAAGIVWAVDNGANVVNLSLGGPSTDRLEQAAVAYAQSHNVVVVAAAGNTGTSTPQYPGSLTGVVSVGATSADGSARSSFSSYGPWVDLAAPGQGITVATPGGGYDVQDGTSFSAPLVSGAVALLEAARPGRSADQLVQALAAGTDNARYGFAHGLVHVDRSLDLLPPRSAPTVTTPGPGSVVTGQLPVIVSSTAAKVRLQLADLVQVVQVVGGTASATFETYGLGGVQQVSATDCSAIDECAEPGPIVPVLVDNPAPVITSPAAGQTFSDGSIPVSAQASGGSVRFFLDDGDVTGVRSVLDAAPPYVGSIRTVGPLNGPHTLAAMVCRSDGAVCDRARAAAVPVEVSQLSPSIVAVSPSAFSPNGDGRQDRTRVTYTLETPQRLTFVVLRADGAVVYSRALGTQKTGRHSLTWNGRRSNAGGGHGGVAVDGDLTVELRTSDGIRLGFAGAPLRLDRAKPTVTSVAVSTASVYPVRDGYRDQVQVSGRLGEAAAAVRLQVLTRFGALVRSIGLGGRAAGPVNATWNGRRAGGRLYSGTYVLRLVALDAAGNRAASRPRTVAVSGARLVRRTGRINANARANLADTYVDDCSQVFPRTGRRHPGWVAMAASGTCTSADAFAAADFQVRLPTAVRFGTVRVSAYGAAGDPRYRDSARLVYYDGRENLSPNSVRLGPDAKTYRGPRAAAEPLLIRSRLLRWMTITQGVSWWDARSFRVDYTYYVLR